MPEASAAQTEAVVQPAGPQPAGLLYQPLAVRRIAGRLRPTAGPRWLPAAAAALLTAACATGPPSLERANLSSMPADVDVAAAVHVAALRAPVTAVVRAADLPVPDWLLQRLVVVVAGVYGGAEPGYLFWMRGVRVDPGMGALLLLHPDWFYVDRPYPHYRSGGQAVLLTGRDSLVMTNLPLDRVERAFDVAEFALPAGVPMTQDRLDLLLVIPDLAAAIRGLAADSPLTPVTDRSQPEFTWVAGTAAADGLQLTGALRTPHAGVARVLAAAAGGSPALTGVRLRADGTWVRLDGQMPFERLIDAAGILLDVQGEGSAEDDA